MINNDCPHGNPLCRKHIICKYRRLNGKLIYPKKGQFFSFCLEDKEKAANSTEQVMTA